MRTRITELFHIQHPVIQGGMAWVSDAVLAAAVSNAGGLGLLAGASLPAETVRGEILRAKELTDKPFGLNIMLMSGHSADLVQLAIEEHLAVVATGAGNPAKYIPALKEAGVKVVPVIPSVAIAKKMEKAGADAVVAEGCESGGHGACSPGGGRRPYSGNCRRGDCRWKRIGRFPDARRRGDPDGHPLSCRRRMPYQ